MGDQRWIGQTPLVVSPPRISGQRPQQQPVFSDGRFSEDPVTKKAKVQANAAVISHDGNVGPVGLTGDTETKIPRPKCAQATETNSPACDCTVGIQVHLGFVRIQRTSDVRVKYIRLLKTTAADQLPNPKISEMLTGKSGQPLKRFSGEGPNDIGGVGC
jgi:hypothetical protein